MPNPNTKTTKVCSVLKIPLTPITQMFLVTLTFSVANTPTISWFIFGLLCLETSRTFDLTWVNLTSDLLQSLTPTAQISNNIVAADVLICVLPSFCLFFGIHSKASYPFKRMRCSNAQKLWSCLEHLFMVFRCAEGEPSLSYSISFFVFASCFFHWCFDR